MKVFSDAFIPPGTREVSGVVQRCPRCIWPYLQPVTALDQAHWLCASCGHCWHFERGRLRPVDPITCHHQFPRFAAGAASDDAIVHT